MVGGAVRGPAVVLSRRGACVRPCDGGTGTVRGISDKGRRRVTVGAAPKYVLIASVCSGHKPGRPGSRRHLVGRQPPDRFMLVAVGDVRRDTRCVRAYVIQYARRREGWWRRDVVASRHENARCSS